MKPTIPKIIAAAPTPTAFKISLLPATGKVLGIDGCVEAWTITCVAPQDASVISAVLRHLRPVFVSTQIWFDDLQSELLIHVSLHPAAMTVGVGVGLFTTEQLLLVQLAPLTQAVNLHVPLLHV